MMAFDEPLTTEAMQKAIDVFNQMFGFNEHRPQEFAQGGAFTVAPQPFESQENCVHSTTRIAMPLEESFSPPTHINCRFSIAAITDKSVEDAFRIIRFFELRKNGRTLGEINHILEAEGFSEVYGEGLMPCPTKSHEIVRNNKQARKMILEQEGFSEVQGANLTPKARK